MTRDERDHLRHLIDQARRALVAPKPRRPLRIVQYGNWTPERVAAGERALAALREATRRARGRAA